MGEKIEFDLIEILQMDDLSIFDSIISLNIVSSIFEHSRENNDIESLAKGIEFAIKIDISTFSNEEKTIYYYNLSNAWAYKMQLRLNPEDIEFTNKEIINQLLNLREALSCCNFLGCNSLKSQILVNLGNTLSHLGRCSESIPLWEEALKYTPDFGMAIGNLGFGVFHYGKVLPLDTYKVIFSQFAYKELEKAIKTNDVYPQAKEDFKNLMRSIEDVVGSENLAHHFDFNNYLMGDSFSEIEYREWSLKNRLFLNYLNDIYSLPIAAHDCLNLASITIKNDEPLLYHDIFNQIKQEFSSARYFIYKGFCSTGIHFADKGNAIVDTSDSSSYSLNIEMLKTGFRMCYSILDKIAIFINQYFDLKVPVNKVNFNRIWYIYNRKGELIDLKPKVKCSHNWLLRGLYWLSRDIFNDKIGVADPEAQDIATIRNFIEHKSFKIAEVENYKIINNELTLVINREEFKHKCLKTLKIVRAATLYLSLAVDLSERMKFDGTPRISLDLPNIDDNLRY